jgi:hypothetical protein
MVKAGGMISMINDVMFRQALRDMSAMPFLSPFVGYRGYSGWISVGSARGAGTHGGAPAFVGKRLYTVPSVHYRDETDICGLVARGGLMITDNPTKVFAGTQSALSTEEQVTLWMASGSPSPAPFGVPGR